jgi:hypothetical protein
MDPAQKGMTRIVVELPDDIAKRLESAWRDVSRGTLKAIALEAYRDGTLSRELVLDNRGLLEGAPGVSPTTSGISMTTFAVSISTRAQPR